MTDTHVPSRIHRRHVPLNVGLVLAQLSGFVTGLVIWFYTSLKFFGAPITRIDYLHMTLGFAMTAAFLTLNTVLAFAVRVRVWVPLTGLVLAVVSAGCALWTLSEAGTRTASTTPEHGEPWWTAGVAFFYLPTSWPLIAACMGMAIVRSSARGATGPSFPVPPALQDH